MAIMCCSSLPSAIMTYFWLTGQIYAFVIPLPNFPTPASRETRATSICPKSTLSLLHRNTMVTRQLSGHIPMELPRRRKRRPTGVQKSGASSSGDDGAWTPLDALGTSNPEELMRQMSIPNLTRKLEQAESTFGAVHPQVAGALIPLAQAMYANRDIGPARQACTRAMKILQRVFGDRPSIEMAECLHTLAMIQQTESPEIGDKALSSQRMALELVTRVCGPQSIEVAAYARSYAQMSEDYSKYLTPGLPRPFYMPNPVPLYRQTLSILENVLGRNNPEVASALDDLSGALLLWRDDEFSDETAATFLPEASTLATRSLEISRRSLGTEHPVTAGRERNLGMVMRGLGQHESARDHFRRSLEILEKVLGSDHPDTQATRALVEEEAEAASNPSSVGEAEGKPFLVEE